MGAVSLGKPSVPYTTSASVIIKQSNKSLSFFLFISTLAQKHVSRQAITTSSSIFSRACYKNPEGVTFYT